jgi:hypothetical protein
MNTTLVALPLIMIVVVGFATQLGDLAESSSQKALHFADDMNKAMECATKGLPITLCSPNVTSYDFSPETEEFTNILEEMEEELSPLLTDLQEEIAQMNATETIYDNETNTTILIYVIDSANV